MKRARIVARYIALLSVVSMQSVHGEVNDKFTFETGMEYFSGNYGTAQHTDVLYVPVTGKYRSKDWSLKMTIPYLEITGTSSVVNGIGQTVVPATNTDRFRSGMGDLSLSVSRNVHNGGPGGLMISLAGKVKVATASVDKGLSTGKDDYAIEATLFKVSERLSPFGTVGYKIYGSPAAYTLNNVFYGSLGASYKLNQESSVGAMLIEGQKVMAKRSARSELIFFGSRTFDKNWKIQGYLLKGLTSSVPDWGGGVLIDYVFELNRKPQESVLSGYSGV